VVPERIGPYKIIRRCGAGGMGEVYLALDTRLERFVALKFLSEEFIRDDVRRQRFFSEARAAAALAHPHICTVYDVAETEDAHPYIAMEWLEGPTLRERLSGSPVPLVELLEIGLGVAEALEAAHARGIVHRDVKPGNVMLAAGGLVKVLDFGLAKWLQQKWSVQSEGGTMRLQTAGGAVGLETESGLIMGTPTYMSPEQATGKPVDQRTDLFSLGVMLYEMATGRVPFGGSNWGEIMRGILDGHPEPITRFYSEAPAELERIIMKCLQKAPEERYQSATDLRIDLAALKASLAAPRSTASGPVMTLLCLEVPEALKLKESGRLQGAAELIRQVQERLQRLLTGPEGKVNVVGDFLLAGFGRPSEAVQVALHMVAETGVVCRLGLHQGEVLEPRETDPLRRYGAHLETAVRLMQLAAPGQILITRGAFDSARVVVKREELAGLGALSWVSHGQYAFAGVEEPLEVCEVGLLGRGVLSPPANTDKASRQVRLEEGSILGWRPAVGQEVPNTKWVLEEKLLEGGFGEVWQARHEKLHERRVFKFCFRADRVRSLKREVTLFRLMKERVGEHPNIVRLYDYFFDQPPYYLEEEYVAGKDLRSWCEARGSVEKVPLEVRLEIVAQVADALQAAHDAGVIHRDVKPGNILISSTVMPETVHGVLTVPQAMSDGSGPGNLTSSTFRAKLTDFGISQVVSPDLLADVTKAGFTHTMLGSDSSSQTGTQLYMAPELWEGKPASTRSDIYSLGVVLYQLLVGDFTRPLTTDWANDITDPLLRDDLHHCVAGKPGDRFAAPALLAKNLRALPQRRTELERQEAIKAALERAAYRRGIVRTAAIASVIVVIIGLLAWQVRSNALAKYHLAKRIGSMLVRLSVANGMNLANSGDWLSAHLWFAEAAVEDEALEVAGYGSLARQNHRLRIDSVLRQAPRLEQMWFDAGSLSGGFDPAGEQVLLGSRSGYRLYHVQSGQAASPVVGVGHEHACLSPDGKRAVTGGGPTNSVFALWDVVRGIRLSCLLAPASEEPFRGDCTDLQFSPDGRWIAAAVQEPGGRVVIWTADTSRHERTLAYADTPKVGWTDGEEIRSVHFDASGERLVTTGTDGRAVIWDWKKGLALHVLQGHESWVYSGCFGHLHTNLVLTCSFDRSACLWDLRTEQPVFRIAHEGDAINDIRFSPDDTMFLTGGLDATVRMWDSRTGRLLPPILRSHDRVMQIGWSADARRVLAMSSDGVARVWRLDSGDSVLTSVTSDFSSDGRLALDRDREGVRLRDVAAGRDLPVPESSSTNISALWFAGGTNRCLAFSSPPGSAPAAAGQLQLLQCSGSAPIGSALAFDPAWSHVVCAADGRRIAFFSGDSADAATSTGKGVLVWEPGSSSAPRMIAFTNEIVECVAFDQKGRRLVVGSRLHETNGVLRLLDLDAQKEPAVLLKSKQWFGHVTFSEDGQWLVAACWDRTLDPGDAFIWRVAEGDQPFGQPVQLHHMDGVLCTAFSPDSQMLATVSEDQTAIVWRQTDDTWKASSRPLRCDGQVYACAFSHDGRWLATANRSRVSQRGGMGSGSHIQVWDIANNEPVTLPLQFAGAVTRLAFVAGDTRLFVERWVPPATPRRWVIDLAMHAGSAQDALLQAELLSGQRSFLSGGTQLLSEALEGILSAEETPHRVASTGPRGPLSKEDCRELWRHFSPGVTTSP
jgi:serine/threonine protein kinase/WD40 repeat protein